VVTHPNILGGAHLIIAKALVETLEKKFGITDAEVNVVIITYALEAGFMSFM
jgi:hypothetical protein